MNLTNNRRRRLGRGDALQFRAVLHHRPTKSASLCTFARSALQCSGVSHPALRVPACGELLCFRHQLLRFLNGFRFLRIRASSDLSSFTCVWHIFIVSHFCHARRSVLHRPATLTCPGPIAPPNLRADATITTRPQSVIHHYQSGRGRKSGFRSLRRYQWSG